MDVTARASDVSTGRPSIERFHVTAGSTGARKSTPGAAPPPGGWAPAPPAPARAGGDPAPGADRGRGGPPAATALAAPPAAAARREGREPAPEPVERKRRFYHRCFGAYERETRLTAHAADVEQGGEEALAPVRARSRRPPREIAAGVAAEEASRAPERLVIDAPGTGGVVERPRRVDVDARSARSRGAA